MSQNDLVIANQTFPNTRSDMNSAYQANGTLQSGATEPSTTYAYQYWADTTLGVLKQRDAGDSAWVIRDTLSNDRVVTKTSGDTIVPGDMNKTILCDATGGAFTMTYTAAATLLDGFRVTIKKIDSTANKITLDGNSSETIDGATTITLDAQFDQAKTVCDGSNHHLESYRQEIAVGSFTRDTSTASGTQAVTGVGFVPRAVSFIAGQNATHRSSWGMDDGSTALGLLDNNGAVTDTYTVNTSSSIGVVKDASDFNLAKITSLDADGFTITWTKTGTPTGTATIFYTAYK